MAAEAPHSEAAANKVRRVISLPGDNIAASATTCRMKEVYNRSASKANRSYHLHYASYPDNVPPVPRGSKPAHRSGCPVSVSLEIFGDRWSLLIIRDLMVRGFQTFKQFHQSGEGIATNILTDRLRKLEQGGLITAEAEDTDGRRVNYRLTEKGIDLAPVLLDLLIWAAKHEDTGAPCALIHHLENNREAVLAEVRRRWQERDSTPFLPKFASGSGSTRT